MGRGQANETASDNDLMTCSRWGEGGGGGGGGKKKEEKKKKKDTQRSETRSKHKKGLFVFFKKGERKKGKTCTHVRGTNVFPKNRLTGKRR